MTTAKNSDVKDWAPLQRQIRVRMAERGLIQSELATLVKASRNAVNRAITHGLNSGVKSRILRELNIKPKATNRT